MDFALTDQQEAIRDAVAKICESFDDAYWLQKDHEGGFPHDFHKALADAGWLGICVPEAYGGSGLGITEAAIMMRTISESGAGMSGASAVYINVFGLNPVVVFGTEEQRKRMLPPMVVRQGIPRRALFARGADPADRAGQPATGAELHRRKSARPSEILLKLVR
jgi:acyl-CoA dehydrogenase